MTTNDTGDRAPQLDPSGDRPVGPAQELDVGHADQCGACSFLGLPTWSAYCGIERLDPGLAAGHQQVRHRLALSSSSERSRSLRRTRGHRDAQRPRVRVPTPPASAPSQHRTHARTPFPNTVPGHPVDAAHAGDWWRTRRRWRNWRPPAHCAGRSRHRTGRAVPHPRAHEPRRAGLSCRRADRQRRVPPRRVPRTHPRLTGRTGRARTPLRHRTRRHRRRRAGSTSTPLHLVEPWHRLQPQPRHAPRPPGPDEAPPHVSTRPGSTTPNAAANDRPTAPPCSPT